MPESRTTLVAAVCQSKTYGNWQIVETATNRSLGPTYVFSGEFAEQVSKAIARSINNSHWELLDEVEVQRLESDKEKLEKLNAKREAEEARIEAEVLKRLTERQQPAVSAPPSGQPLSPVA